MFESGQRAPSLSDKSKSLALQALLAENARLAADAKAATASQPALAANNLSWNDQRVEQALFDSGQRVTLIKDTKRAEMLQALLAESTRLAEKAKQQAPAKPSFFDWLRHLISPRALGTMGATLSILLAVVAYGLVGGARPATVASAQGSFALAEKRQGPLGIQWSLPRSYANASDKTISPGDEVIATSPVTITYDNGLGVTTTVVVASGAQLRVLPGTGVSVIKGEMQANSNAQAANEQFKIESIAATLVMTDASTRVKVEETGIISQYTDKGRVLVATATGMTEVAAGEQASIATDGQTEKGLQPPLVAGTKTDDGKVIFTAQAASGSTVVVLDSQTGNELASFIADKNGIVNGQIVPPPGTSATSIDFRTEADGKQSNSTAAVTDGTSISSSTNDTVLPPAPVKAPTEYSVPALSLPAFLPIEATGPRGAIVTFEVTATDLQQSSVPVTCNTTSGASFSIGTTPVECTATNSQGRTATGSFRIVVVDTTPPTLTMPQDKGISASFSGGAAVAFSVVATDSVDGTIVPQCSNGAGSTFQVGNTTVTCTATDKTGNAARGTFVVSVRDASAPILQLPEAVNASATSRSGAEVNFSATANDLIDGAISPVCTPRSGALFGMGSTTVNCVAIDKAGNDAKGSFSVVVRDQTPPSIDVPDTLVTQATAASGATVSFNTSANDVVDGSIGVTCSPRSGQVFTFGNTTVTCRATRLCWQCRISQLHSKCGGHNCASLEPAQHLERLGHKCKWRACHLLGIGQRLG